MSRPASNPNLPSQQIQNLFSPVSPSSVIPTQMRAVSADQYASQSSNTTFMAAPSKRKREEEDGSQSRPSSSQARRVSAQQSHSRHHSPAFTSSPLASSPVFSHTIENYNSSNQITPNEVSRKPSDPSHNSSQNTNTLPAPCLSNANDGGMSSHILTPPLSTITSPRIQSDSPKDCSTPHEAITPSIDATGDSNSDTPGKSGEGYDDSVQISSGGTEDSGVDLMEDVKPVSLSKSVSMDMDVDRNIDQEVKDVFVTDANTTTTTITPTMDILFEDKSEATDAASATDENELDNVESIIVGATFYDSPEDDERYCRFCE